MVRKSIFFGIFFIGLIIIILGIVFLSLIKINQPREFDGQSAFGYVKYQVELGARTIGSQAHEQAALWIIDELKNDRWSVEIQETQISGIPVKNIIAKRGGGSPWIILGSHYDSRATADRDKVQANQALPVPGANDGATSTAILLELARVLPAKLNKEIWLVFFDAEDNGDSSGVNWEIGSRYFVSQLTGKPDSVIVLDMVGDQDLNIYMENNSNHELNAEIWGVAKELGYSQFIPDYKYGIIDDHIPFVQAGMKAADVIDFSYPYWHTTDDTVDKISAESLEIVGRTIMTWLQQAPK